MTPRRRFTVMAASAALLATVAAGCTGEPGQPENSYLPESSSTATPPPNPPPEVDPSPGPPVSPGTDTVDPKAPTDGTEQAASPGFPDPPPGVAVLPTEVKAATQGNVERVTIELTGSGEPGYGVQYAAEVFEPGSGKRIDLGTDHTLQIILTGVRNPNDGEKFATGEVTNIPADGPIRKIQVVAPYEGQTMVVLGLEQRRPFTVTREQNRLVIDITLR